MALNGQQMAALVEAIRNDPILAGYVDSYLYDMDNYATLPNKGELPLYAAAVDAALDAYEAAQGNVSLEMQRGATYEDPDAGAALTVADLRQAYSAAGVGL